MQEYVNQQTEYINSVMTSKDDILENHGANIKSLLEKVSLM